MRRVLITGSNRGLGLEWARQLCADGWEVLATCRHPADAGELNALAAEHGNLSVHRLDITSAEDVRAIHWALRDRPLDLLVNNAGVYLEKGGPHLGGMRYDDWLRTLEVNTLGPVRVTEALAGQLEMGTDPTVVVTSSHMGSIEDIISPGSYYYRSSKAALNAAFKGLAADLKQRGIAVLLIHHGAVRTRMGGPESVLSPEQSVSAMRRVLSRAGIADTGRFFRYDGTELPW
jgi:NAD(P)-dependent dehydrogenase (short-subunit alcohol dehydrogenase family)